MTASSAGATESAATRRRAGRWSVGAVLGAAAGLAPHLLHHVSLFAGTALLAGLGGTALFAVLGLATMAPMLIRLRRRFGTWWAPGIAMLLFAAMFAGSTLVIGPALRGAVDDTPQPGPSHSTPAGEHTRHHG
ncbi:hypothetical protein E1193_16445 [Micromonospora sp. KC606]|uniref:hypothetical protein n=1 Tax=Micromonospora sp. KC606 TaxID=2530379 RepID=UPI0010431D1C|nr:hypothetical protein [Micromonospora sp. KC606]TDC80873.1 hypothetical protein E1193_16445 [Micromonospora sp. KC606]